jgi:hypothetical protein
VIVSHIGVPASAARGDEVPQPPDTVGSHTNASPQSLSALQGSCHLNAQMLRVVVVQTSVPVTTVPASHFVFGAHPAVATPLPVQEVVCCW